MNISNDARIASIIMTFFKKQRSTLRPIPVPNEVWTQVTVICVPY